MGERQPRVTANEIIKVLKSLGFKKLIKQVVIRSGSIH